METRRTKKDLLDASLLLILINADSKLRLYEKRYGFEHLPEHVVGII